MRDLYQEVTDKIIAQLEAGTVPWVRPWTGAESPALPSNFASGKTYRGINVALLWATGYADQRWLTYKQAQDMGAQVRKGEKGTMIVFFKPWAIKDVNAVGESIERTIPVIKAFSVFNIAQIDGLTINSPMPKEPVEIRYANAAATFGQAKATHGEDRAFYSPDHDIIGMPGREQFASEESYWATALHELTHWTGAREELCAEMGSAFLCAELGIRGQLQHPAYIASWLEVLRSDKKAVLQAASAAQKAADFVLRREPAKAEEQEAA